MLLINLLPWRKTRMRQWARRWLRLLWLQMGLMACLIVVVYLFWQHRQQRSQNELNTVQAEQRQLTMLYQQIYDARETLRRYQIKEEADATVRRENLRALHVLEPLASLTPARLWLTEIADRGSYFLLSGVSENYKDIIVLQSVLSRHASIDRVQLLHTSRERGVNVWLRFSLRADWRRVFPASQGENHG